MRWVVVSLMTLAACAPAPKPQVAPAPVQQGTPSTVESLLQAEMVPSRFEPPGWYTIWWATIERCAGKSGDFDRITWISVPKAFITFTGGIHQGQLLGAFALPDRHTIVVGIGFTDVEKVIKHEMLHELLGQSETEHDPHYFKELCGAEVGPTR